MLKYEFNVIELSAIMPIRIYYLCFLFSKHLGKFCIVANSCISVYVNRLLYYYISFLYTYVFWQVFMQLLLPFKEH